MEHALEAVTQIIEAEPRSGQALLLYALVKTLSTETGHAYTLNKLREIDPENRQLCYTLMELMAREYNQSADWQVAVARMDAAFRNE